MIEVETEKRFNIVDKLFGFMSDVNNYDLEKMYDHEFTIKNEQGDTVTYGYDENGFGIKEPGNQSYNFLEMMGKAQMNKSKSEAQMAEDTLNFMSKPDKIERTAKGFWRGFAIGAKNTGDLVDLITGGLYSSSGIRQSAGSMSMENLPDRQEGALGMVSEIAGQYAPTGFGSYAVAKKILPKGFATLGSWKNFGRILLAELGMEFTAGGTADPEATNIPAMLQMFGLADAEGQDVYNKIVDSLARDEDDTTFEAKYKDAFGNLPVAGFVEFIFPFYKSMFALKHNKQGRELFAKELGLEAVKDNGLEGVFKVTNKDGEVIASFDREDLANKLVQSLGEEFEVQSFKEGGASVVVPDNINKVPLEKLNKSEEPFYSNVVNAIQKIDIPEQGINSEQLLNTIKNQPGVKQSELDDMGLETFLAENPIVTKAQIDEFVDKKALTNKVNTTVLDSNNNKLENWKIDNPEFDEATSFMDIMEIIDQSADESLVAKQFETWTKNNQDLPIVKEHEKLLKLLKSNKDSKFLRGEYQSQKNHLIQFYIDKELNLKPEDISSSNKTKTFYDEHTLPGGEDYKELLISSNGTAQVYRGDAHFSKTGAIPSGENLLAHVRFNTRTINGKKTLFIEELQSDLHQTGRKEGYVGGQTDLQKRHQELIEKMDGLDEEGLKKIYPEFKKVSELLDEENLKTVKKVPNAPFKKNWHELAMKRIIKYAIDNDFEAISFTPGSVQVERYDLSKHIDQLFYNETTGSLNGYQKGETVLFQQNVTKDNLADYVGKEIAERLINAPVEKATQIGAENMIGKRLTGVDLKVGGEGMIGFYDKMLPSFINKFVKKYKTKLTNTELVTNLNFNKDAKFNYQNTVLRNAKNIEEAYDLIEQNDYLNKEFMFYIRDELNELDPENLIKNANQDEIKAYKDSFLANDYGLDISGPAEDQIVPFLEITPEMKMDIYEKGVPIAKVKKKKVNQQSTRMA